MSKRLPETIDYGTECVATVQALLSSERLEEDFLDLFEDQTSERLFGYVMPPFQRPPVWSRQQQVRFVESLWMSLPVGHYVVNTLGDFSRMDNWLIDGQQRLRALKAFFNDEFDIFDLHWSEFSDIEKRAFKNRKFPFFETKLRTEDEVRDLYNRMAFGGTAHEEHQRA